MQNIVAGKAYVLGDNIDTDQIIPAHYLTLNPAIPAERAQFGRHALSGVPSDRAGLPTGNVPFVDQSDESNTRSDYSIIVAGKNFGCGSSREHAPLALAEAGIKAEIITRDWGMLKQAINSGEPDAYYMTWYADYPDGENFLFPTFHSINWGGGGNRARYKNPRVDALIERARGTLDEEERGRLYRQIDELVLGVGNSLWRQFNA